MGAKRLPAPKVRYMPAPEASEDALAEVYAILFKKVLQQNAFANQKGYL